MHLRPIWWPAIVVLLAVADAQTPVIGGLCKLGSNDVQIGGKQTQFFLKCEERQGSDEKAYGVWVVKSRASPIDEPEPSHPKSIPTTRRRTQATCQQDHEARVGLPCVYGGECLQFNYDDATTYLQCDADSRWIKRICGNNLVFSFHHQACIGDGTNTIPGRVPQPNGGDAAPSYRQAQQSQLLCPNNTPCDKGTCAADQICVRNVCCYLPSTTLLFHRFRRLAESKQSQTTCPDGKSPLISPKFCSLHQPCPIGYACNEARRCCKLLSSSLCPDDSKADGSCSKSTPCNRGYYCTAQNICCKRSKDLDCPSGDLPLDHPAVCRISSDCPHGFQCSTSRRCCHKVTFDLETLENSSREITCPAGDSPIGFCRLDSDCPTRYWCIAGVCCATPQFLLDPAKRRKQLAVTVEKKADLLKSNILLAKKFSPTPATSVAVDSGDEVEEEVMEKADLIKGSIMPAKKFSPTVTPTAAIDSGYGASKPDEPTIVDQEADTTTTTASTTLAAVAEKQSSAAPLLQANGYGGDLCPDGTPALPRSCGSDADCPADFACSQNRCCGTSMCSNGFRPLPDSKPCSNECPIGYECTTNGCCASDDSLTCPDGQLPLSYPPSCGTTKDCPSGFLCTASRVCCEIRTCDDGSPPLPDPTECSANVACPSGYKCHAQWWFCCLDSSVEVSPPYTTGVSTSGAVCPGGAPALPDRTQCNVALPCPDSFVCDSELQLCCPAPRQCYDGSSPLDSPSSCSSSKSCPSPYTCQLNICCLPPPATVTGATSTYGQTPNTLQTYRPAQVTTPYQPPPPPITSTYVQPTTQPYTTQPTTIPFVPSPPPPTPSAYELPPPPPTVPLPPPTTTTSYQPPPTQPLPPPSTLPPAPATAPYQPPPAPPTTQAPLYTPNPATQPPFTTVAVPVATSAPYRFCPNGAQPLQQQCSSAGGSANGLLGSCPPGSNCVNGLCCPELSVRACADGSQPLPDPPTCDAAASQCPASASCQNGVCCQNRNCPTGQPPLPFPASCSLLQPCPATAECYGGVCCPRSQVEKCPDGSLPLPVPTSCTDQCPYGSQCIKGVCCQQSTPPPPPPQQQCADGAAPLQSPPTCSSYQPCPPGSECVGSVCCPVKEVVQQKCPDGSDPLPSPGPCSTAQDCPFSAECISSICCLSQANVCPDGSTPVSACSQFSPCASGYQCQDGGCCLQAQLPTGQCSNGGQPLGTCLSTGYSTSPTPVYTVPPVAVTPAPQSYTSPPPPPVRTEPPPTYTIPPPVYTKNPYVRLRRQTGQCEPGYVCEGNVCCPLGQPQSGACSDGSAPLPNPSSCGSGGTYSEGPSGACPAGYLCENNRCCQERTTQAPTCPDGSSPLPSPASCAASDGSQPDSASSCPAGYACANSVCCVEPKQLTCPDGSSPLSRGVCSTSNPCPTGSSCTSEGACCKQQEVCVDGSQPLPGTSCNNYNNLCPAGYTCLNNLCCGGSGGGGGGGGSQGRTCSDGAQPLANTQCGPLQQCPPGYVCEGNGNCCLGVLNQCPDGTPPLNSPGQCASNAACPPGFNCVGNRCCLQRICPDGSEALSSPASCASEADCPSGYTCANGICCAARQCPNGSPSQTFCDGNKNCPNGQTCIGFICCNNFVQIARSPTLTASCSDGSEALSRPATCTTDEQCPLTFACENRRCCPEHSACPDGRHVIPGSGQCTQLDRACGDGECFNGVCCSRTRTCPDGTPALGECDITGRCGSAGAQCLKGMCCQLKARSDDTCPGGGPPLPARGCSLVALCPASFTCISGQCCPAQHLCPDQSAPPFRCSQSSPCESSEHQCMISDGQGICCRRVSAGDLCADGSAPLPSLTGLTCSRSLPCPDGYLCERGGKCCKIMGFATSTTSTTIDIQASLPESGCPNGEPPLPTLSGARCGPSLVCPPRFDCINGDCCAQSSSSPTAFQPTAPPVFRQQPTVNVEKLTEASVCSDATKPLSRCSSNLDCPTSYLCEKNVCCRSVARCPVGTIALPGYRCDLKTKWCPANFACLTGGVCCANRKTASNSDLHTCPDLSEPLSLPAACNGNNACPHNFFCSTTIRKCCSRASSQYVAQAGGMVCTFSECSVNKPCPQGAECNNGYCCEITSVLPQPVFAAATNVIRNCPDNTPSLQQGCVSDSECPSGYNCPVDVGACCKIAVNFPLPSTDAQAIPVPVQLPAMSAFPNNRRNQFMRCAGGFSSSLRCGFDSECPTGLFCDVTISLCCPLLLPLSEVDQNMYERSANHIQQPKSNFNNNNYLPNAAPSTFSSYPESNSYGSSYPQSGPAPSDYGQTSSSSFESSSNYGSGESSSLTAAYGTVPAGEQASHSSSSYGLSGESSAYQPAPAPSYGPSSNSPYPSPASSYPSPANSPYPQPASSYPSPFDGMPPAVSPYDYTSGYGNAQQPYELAPESGGSTGESYGVNQELDSQNERKRFPYPYASQYSTFSAYPTGSVGCNGCGAQPMPVAAPVAVASSSCTAGCPRGYSGCCGTQQASCCVRQECPGGQMSTGRSCYTSCPSGQSCNAGVCCPSLSCPGGSQPIGSCSNGFCSQGYQCVRSVNVCCASIQAVLTCPTGAQAVGQCINGQCGTGYSCDLSTNLCCPSIGQSNNFICTDGSQAAGACIGGLCGAGFSCVNNLCCRGSSSTLRCLDGTTPLGTCLNGLCPLNFQCSLGNICCGTGAAQNCPNGGTAIGPCTSNLCPVNFLCNTANNQCCPSAGGTTCPNNVPPLGPCVDGNCPLGFACNTAVNQCCQSTVTATCPAGQASIGPCISGLCPPGNTCIGNICCAGTGTGTTDTCANNAPSIGPCVGGLCPPGNTCVNNNICCPIARLHRAPAIESSPDGVIRRQQPVVDQIGSCPNGQQAIGQCISGLCGAGFTCINNLCCSTTTTGNNINLCPNGQAGVGACFPGGQCGVGFTCDLRTNLCCSPSNGMVGGNSVVITVCQSGSQPLGTCPTGQNTCPSGYACEGTICCRQSGDIVVGGQCQQPQQCAGYPQGLATCVDQTCRCQPVAYVQGIACVRRRMLRLKFNDDGNVDSAEDEERAEEEVVKEESKSS